MIVAIHPKKEPDWFFWILVCVSFGIHVAVFMHISGFYSLNALTCIELTLQDISKPPARSIPRPHRSLKETLQPKNVKRLKVTIRPMPYLKPMKSEPSERDMSDTIVEKIVIPDFSVAEWTPGKPEEIFGEYTTSNSYLEMVKLKIERHKRYPDIARTRQMEGRVSIRFAITPEGNIKEAEIVKKSRYKNLDEAALMAVELSAPFPKPPERFFKGGITMIITIVFELT